MPAPLARFLEWYLELPRSGSGEGTAWRLLWGPAAGSELSPQALCWLAVVAVGLIVGTAWLAGRTAPRRHGWLQVSLRLAAAAVSWLMLGRLSLQVDRTELPTVAVLVDVSASMGHTDRYVDPRLAKTARTLRLGPDELTRLGLVQRILERDEGRWWQTLQTTHRVQLYAFDEHARALDTEGGATDLTPELLSAVGRLTASGAGTAPATAVREVLDEFRGHPLSGIVLFTDGIANRDDERLTRAAALARQRGVPLFPVGVGGPDPERDLELFDLLADEVAYLGEPLTLGLQYRSFGLAGQSSRLTVTVLGETSPRLTKEVQLAGDRVATPVDLSFTLPEEGEYELLIQADAVAGESNLENNQLRQHVEVRREPLRVLLVDGSPRWEYRALKPVLERDDTVQLQCYLHSADREYAAEDRTALRSFPVTQDQLNRYDVIVWGDVDLSLLGPDVGELLQRFVVEHGGGLVCIAGEEFHPQEYRGTPLEVLLPVSLEGAVACLAGPGEAAPRLELTVEGRSQRFLRLADDAADDDLAWQALPPAAEWFIRTPQVKPGASVLAVGARAGEAPAPLIVQQRIGRGQVLYHGFDSTWKWRRRVEDRYFGRYWSQAVRAVAARRNQRSNSLELTPDRRIYQPGEIVTLQLRGTGADISPGAPVTISVHSTGTGERYTLELTAVTPGAEVRRGILKDLPLGQYRAVVAAPGEAAAVECRFRVEMPDHERRERAIAEQDLLQAARLTQGSYQSFADADQVPARLPRGRTVRLTQIEPLPLWNRWETLLLVSALLCAEWLLRQRAHVV